MRFKTVCLLALATSLAISINSCEKEGGKCGEKNISATNSNRSHNMGQNCMNCHKDGGSGEGCFTIAGTTYNSSGSSIYSNAIVKLYTQPNGLGSVVATLQGDSKGNFHTTESVDFGSGLYTVVINTLGQSVYMSSAVTQGACNSCHGATQPRISTF